MPPVEYQVDDANHEDLIKIRDENEFPETDLETINSEEDKISPENDDEDEPKEIEAEKIDDDNESDDDGGACEGPTNSETNNSNGPGIVSREVPRRSGRVRRPPGSWWSKAFLTIDPESRALITSDEDLSYGEVTSGPDSAFWKQAIESELSSLEKNKTWSFVSQENEKNVLTSKWDFKVKDVIHPDRTVTENAKARLVVRGFQQVQGMDFNETYAHAVKFTSVRAVLALSACLDLDLHQIDAVNAFLSGDLDENIFMEDPRGVSCDKSEDLVCKFNKALYGLKQATGQWNAKIDAFLVEQLGFEKCPGYPCLYLKWDPTSNTLMIIALYVDDLLIGGNNPNSYF